MMLGGPVPSSMARSCVSACSSVGRFLLGVTVGFANQTIGVGSKAELMLSSCECLVQRLYLLIHAERWGRRCLCLFAGIQMLVFQEIAVPALIRVKYGVKGDQIEVVVCICIYVTSFLWWSAIGWLYPREIFQLEDVQSSGKSTRAANMLFTFIFTFIVTQTFLRMLCVMKFGSFIFLAFLVVMTLYCYYFMEETENIAIE
ncbi:UNVERIFIED_CONTAM: Sugar transport protein 12 [Sesamum calycinum]|uniref:Sugar transport protein 12 n=1 Tax=Sesamum calycinum TaxID=2727403 RepID=A0AAW2NUF4_9LAMI